MILLGARRSALRSASRAGTYLAEHGRHSRLAAVVSFINDILLERAVDRHRPVRLRTGGRDRRAISPAYAGALALAMILLPIVVRTTDESLRLVPDHDARGRLRARPAALAGHAADPLQGGAERHPDRRPARRRADQPARPRRCSSPRSTTSSGAPNLNAPLANVPVVIFQYAMSPYDEWHALAWAGAFVLTAFVLVLNIARPRLLARKGRNDERRRPRLVRIDDPRRDRRQRAGRRSTIARSRFLLRQDAGAEAAST